MSALYKAILADLDGTINRGDTLIPGVKEVYELTRRKGAEWVFISNNASKLDTELAAKLRRFGLQVQDKQVVTSASALLERIRNGYIGSRFLVVGEQSLAEGIELSGGMVTGDPLSTQIVVIALDRTLTYAKIRDAHLALQHGAEFWATNLDPTYPVESGLYPGAGSIVAAVATAVGRPPDLVLGKPYTHMAEIVTKRLRIPATDCLVIGDRMDTDVLFATRAGMDSAFVLTGAGVREDLFRFEHEPTYVFDHISEVSEFF